MTTYTGKQEITFEVDSGDVLVKNRLVKFKAGSPNKVVALAAVADIPCGVVQHASANGDTDEVNVAIYNGGIVEIEAGAAIAAGARLRPLADGRVTSGGTGDNYVAQANTAAAAAGDLVECLMVRG